MLPAGSHGQAAGDAIYSLTVLPDLINWTEAGQAPQKLDAWQTDSTGTVMRTYPVYPLPAVAKYTGSGNVKDEASWTSYIPISNLHFRWLGDPGPAPFPYAGWHAPGTGRCQDAPHAQIGIAGSPTVALAYLAAGLPFCNRIAGRRVPTWRPGLSAERWRDHCVDLTQVT